MGGYRGDASVALPRTIAGYDKQWHRVEKLDFSLTDKVCDSG